MHYSRFAGITLALFTLFCFTGTQPASAQQDVTVNGGNVTVSGTGSNIGVTDTGNINNDVAFANGATASQYSFNSLQLIGGVLNFDAGSAITGGTFNASGGMINFYGGNFSDFTDNDFLNTGATVNVYGGTFTSMGIGIGCPLTIYGGTFTNTEGKPSVSNYDSNVTILGGDLTNGIDGRYGPTTIDGGTVADITTESATVFNIYGGNIEALDPSGAGQVTLFGTFPQYGLIPPGQNVVGTLSDGTPINAPVGGGIGAGSVTLAQATPSAQAQVNVKLYRGATDTGSGVTFGTLAETFSSSQIAFLTDYNRLWYPLGNDVGFGADVTGTIYAPKAGQYTITLDSDDGSYLFSNGQMVINDGGNHFANEASATVTLAAGQAFPFEIQYREDGTIQAGLDLLVSAVYSDGTTLPQELVPASFFTPSGLQISAPNVQSWVGNTSDFTVNVTNIGSAPQMITSATAAIAGTPPLDVGGNSTADVTATLISALPTAPLQPGQQTQLTFALTVPGTVAIAAHQSADLAFNVSVNTASGSFQEPMTVALTELPSAQATVTVTDANTNAPLANALVAVDDDPALYYTNNQGVVTLNAAPGVRTVYAYAQGHLPSQLTEPVVAGSTPVAFNLALQPGNALQVQSVTTTQLTPTQAAQDGVNLSDPSNYFVYDFVVKMEIGPVPVNDVVLPAHPTPGSTVTGTFGSGGGPSGTYSIYYPTSDPTQSVATWIIIPGDVRVLKQLWDATVFIQNNSILPINNLVATLGVPAGLSLPQLNGASQSPTQTLGTIAPETSEQVDYVVRGDDAGTYTLSGTATGSLSLGGASVPLSSTLRSAPFTVYAPQLQVSFMTPTAVSAGQDFTLGIDITNNSPITLNDVQIDIAGNPLARNLVNCALDTSKNPATVDLGSMAPGQTIDQPFQFISFVTGVVEQVQTYVSPTPLITPDVTVNAGPFEAGSDTATTVAGQSVDVPVLSNVVDSTLNPTLSVVSPVGLPQNGRATTDGSTITYTPDSGFTGTDQFAFTAQDTAGNTGTGTVTVTVTAPAPSISPSGLVPASLPAGSAGQTLTINGSGFVAASQVTFNGVLHPATFVSPNQLTINLSAADLASAGLAPVVVSNGGLGGGTATESFSITGGTSSLLSNVAPNTVPAGSSTATITVTGIGFGSASVVNFQMGGANTFLATTYVSAHQITAVIPASLLTEAGTASISVTDGGIASNVSLPFTITPSSPVLKITLGTVTRSGGSIAASFSVSNAGSLAATGLQVVSAKLLFLSGGKLSRLPASSLTQPASGSLAAGASETVGASFTGTPLPATGSRMILQVTLSSHEIVSSGASFATTAP